MKRAYTVELRSTPVEGLDEVMDAFATALFADRRLAGPVPSANLALRTLELLTSVDAATPEAALGTASRGFLRAARRAGSDVEIVEAIISIEGREYEDRQELVSGAEVARRLGVSRQRVQQLTTIRGRFPRAAAKFGTVSAWRWGDIADWARAQERPVSVKSRRRSA